MELDYKNFIETYKHLMDQEQLDFFAMFEKNVQKIEITSHISAQGTRDFISHQAKILFYKKGISGVIDFSF